MLARIRIASLVVAVSALPAAADCTELYDQIKTALGDHEVERYGQLYEAVREDPTCDGSVRDQVGRLLALSTLTTLSVDSSAEAIEVEAAKFGRPWQVLVAIGDAHYRSKEWRGAVVAYDEALIDIQSRVEYTPSLQETGVHVYRRSAQANALGPQLPASVRLYRGSIPDFRGFANSAELWLPPVWFPSGSSTLTDAGAAAIAEIQTTLGDGPAEHITIVGHNDPTEGDQLSMQRASSVAQALKDQGFTGTINVQGVGNIIPFTPDDDVAYSEAELHTLSRRVEVQVTSR